MDIFLDLWGVLLDEKKMNREYNERAASILAVRFGGDPARWLAAYNGAWEDYRQRFRMADWVKMGWSDVAGELDVKLISDTLDAVGVKTRPPDLLSFARNLEFEVVSLVAECYPEVPGAVRKLKNNSHRVHVATQVGEWNAIGALGSSGLLKEIDEVFTGSGQNFSKTINQYWVKALRQLGNAASRCILADDNLDFLEAAASVGIRAILVDRAGKKGGRRVPRFIKACMSTLASLPPYVEKMSRQ